jgi:DNA-binding MarR family transcriptional regulator
MLDALGLTYPQYLVMLVLWERDVISVGELGERLNLDSGTLTPLLKRLEAQGRLVRNRSSQDERRVEVSLTDDGRALRAQARAIPPRILEGVGCTLDQLGPLTQRLQDLRLSLQRR